MWKRLADVIVNTFIRRQRNLRSSMIANSLIMPLVGAGIGALCAFWVLTMNDVLKTPWSYLCIIAIPFLAKALVMWVGTLIVAPSVGNLTSMIFRIQTGITVPEYQWPSVGFTGNVLTFPVAAAIAVTIYLSELSPDSENTVNDDFVYYIATLVGTVVSLTENLSNPTVIKAIWHNRADYQESPLFNKSQDEAIEPRDDDPEGSDIGVQNTDIHTYQTRAQKRRANRGRRAGKR